MKRRRFLQGSAAASMSLSALLPSMASGTTSPALYTHPATAAAGVDDLAGWNVPHDADVHVVRVTNLKNRGLGSLRDALQRTDIPRDAYRVVVFDVSGRIDITGQILRANQDKTIVAGQTAPGPVEIWGHIFQARKAKEQLFMHLAFRGGKIIGNDSWQFDNVTKVRFQNCSGANSVDEMVAFNNSNSTQAGLVDCLIGFQLFDNGDHRFGPFIRNTNTKIGLYRNFFVGARRGMLRLENSCTVSCASNAFVAVDESPTENVTKLPMVLEEKREWPPTMTLDFFENEYIWPGSGRLAQLSNDIGVVTTIYERDNYIRDAYSNLGSRILSEPALGAVQVPEVQIPPGARLITPGDVMPFVMAHAGMRPAFRDLTDMEIVAEVIAESIPTRTEPADYPPPTLHRPFIPQLDWSQKDAQGRSNALVELDQLHGELGGVRRWG